MHGSSISHKESKDVHRSKSEERDICCNRWSTFTKVDEKNITAVAIQKKGIEWVKIKRVRVDKGEDDVFWWLLLVNKFHGATKSNDKNYVII